MANTDIKISLTIQGIEGSIQSRLNHENFKCSQHLNLTSEAYEHMISDAGSPRRDLNNLWKRISNIKRLEFHFKELTEYFNGTSYDYEVFND